MAVPMAFDRLEVITDGGRRRRYAPEEKGRLVANAFASGVSVTAFAREHGVDPSLLYRWRRQMGSMTRAAAAVSFAPVIVTPDAARATPRGARTERIEIVLTNGRRITVGPDADVAAVARLADALDPP